MKSCGTLIRRGGAWSSYTSIRAAVERLAAVVLVLPLAACSSTASIDRSATRTGASADDAFVFPPVGGPSIVGVIQGKRSGGIYQEVLLGTDAVTPGQNQIQVTVYENNAPLVNPYPRIAAEMRGALPGVRMVRSPYYVQNRYGPFGYAFGHSGARDLCLFGWQSIRTRATPMTKQGGIDVRVRVCETGATEQKLLSIMYGYTIDAFISSQRWNPYGDPLPPATELGQRAGNIYPAGPDHPGNQPLRLGPDGHKHPSLPKRRLRSQTRHRQNRAGRRFRHLLLLPATNPEFLPYRLRRSRCPPQRIDHDSSKFFKL